MINFKMMANEIRTPAETAATHSQWGVEDLEEEDDAKAIQRIWLNERMSPYLLPYAESVVCNISELLANQEDRIQQLAGKNGYANLLAQMEIERIRFVCCGYLKCRLAKIESAVFLATADYSDGDAAQGRRRSPLASRLLANMSSGELVFMRRVFLAVAKACSLPADGSAIGRLLDSTDDQHPRDGGGDDDECTFVIVRVVKDVGEIIIDHIEQITAQLCKDDIFVLQYSIVHRLLLSGHVILI